MAFFDRLNQMAKNIGDKTSDAIETTKLNSRMNAERAAAAEELEKIGAYYYDCFASGGSVAPEVLEFCHNAKAHYDAATEAQDEIERIRAENEAQRGAAAPAAAPTDNICPSCAAQNAPGTKFCRNCGMKLEAPPAAAGNVCPSCAMENGPGTRFCQNCGARLEAPLPPQERRCPGCGTLAGPGVKFCAVCGQRMEG